MARPENDVLKLRPVRIGQFHHKAFWAVFRSLTVKYLCTCVWLTAYSDKKVIPPPIIKVNQECLTVGSGSKLEIAIITQIYKILYHKAVVVFAKNFGALNLNLLQFSRLCNIE